MCFAGPSSPFTRSIRMRAAVVPIWYPGWETEERRARHLRQIQIIESDNGDVFGAMQARLAKSHQSAEGNHVVSGEDGCRLRNHTNEQHRLRISTVLIKGCFLNVFRADVYLPFSEGALETSQAILNVCEMPRTHNHCEPFMSLPKQVACRVIRAVLVVGSDAVSVPSFGRRSTQTTAVPVFRYDSAWAVRSLKLDGMTISPDGRYVRNSFRWTISFAWSLSLLQRTSRYPSVKATSSVPRTTAGKKGLVMSGMIIPIMFVLSRRSPRASWLGW